MAYVKRFLTSNRVLKTTQGWVLRGNLSKSVKKREPREKRKKKRIEYRVSTAWRHARPRKRGPVPRRVSPRWRPRDVNAYFSSNPWICRTVTTGERCSRSRGAVRQETACSRARAWTRRFPARFSLLRLPFLLVSAPNSITHFPVSLFSCLFHRTHSGLDRKAREKFPWNASTRRDCEHTRPRVPKNTRYRATIANGASTPRRSWTTRFIDGIRDCAFATNQTSRRSETPRDTSNSLRPLLQLKMIDAFESQLIPFSTCLRWRVRYSIFS